MPVRNTALFLESCLDSILKQTYSDWELIAIDDHSTDTSFDILSTYAERDVRIRVIKNEGKGIIHALRLAYAHSSGEFITRMDSDDIMMEQKIEALHHALKNKTSDHIALGCVEYFSEHNLGEGYQKYAEWLNELTRSENNFTEIYKECVVPSPCWMLHRDVLDRCGGFEPDTYPEDYDLCFRMYKAKLKVAGVSDVIHRWRDHDTRTSRTDEHYADNRFLPLKMSYFLDIDYRNSHQLVLWGAGKKGKWIARHLIKKGISFHWVTDNEKKIGHDIYGVVLEESTGLSRFKEIQIIVSAANKKDQFDIHNIIQSLDSKSIVYYFA